MFKFLARFGINKAEKVADDIVAKIVAADPAAASEAQLDMMDADLDNLTCKLVEARNDYNREQKEADEIVELKKERVSAAQYLKSQLEAMEEGSSEYDSTMEGLLEIVNLLEEMQPEIDRELREAVEAKDFLDSLEDIAKEQAAQIQSARAELKSAQTRMKHAALKEERAEQRAAKRAELDGLKTKKNKLTVALDAMNKNAQASEDKVSALEIKERLTTKTKKTSSAAEAAMAHVKGKPASVSVLDRLSSFE